MHRMDITTTHEFHDQWERYECAVATWFPKEAVSMDIGQIHGEARRKVNVKFNELHAAGIWSENVSANGMRL